MQFLNCFNFYVRVYTSPLLGWPHYNKIKNIFNVDKIRFYSLDNLPNQEISF